MWTQRDQLGCQFEVLILFLHHVNKIPSSLLNDRFSEHVPNAIKKKCSKKMSWTFVMRRHHTCASQRKHSDQRPKNQRHQSIAHFLLIKFLYSYSELKTLKIQKSVCLKCLSSMIKANATIGLCQIRHASLLIHSNQLRSNESYEMHRHVNHQYTLRSCLCCLFLISASIAHWL